MQIQFPRPVYSVHQIEITSRCNLRCVYCPSKDIADGKYTRRPAVDMTREHFSRALEWVEHYVAQGVQVELNLAGIGESTLHPNFLEFVSMARCVMPIGKLIFATNGLICSETLAAELAALRVDVFVSLHRPEKAALAIATYQKHGVLKGVSADPAISANNWAGQVEWIESGHRFQCPWLRDGKLFVLADGHISRCCLDAKGAGILGHVDDEIGSIKTSPYELCKTCYQDIPADNWDQKQGCAK